MAPPPTTEEVENTKASNLPPWINEENFQSILEENVEGFSKTINFEVKETGGAGENYASVMMRVKAKVELKDGSSKDVAFMIKMNHQGEQGAGMAFLNGIFPKEAAMYSKLLEFEEMYESVGKKVTFGPKFYKLKNDPGVEYILLEDLSPRGFKNLRRQEGLDEEHTKSVLKMLAELHAASAVRFEQKGDYEDSFMKSPFTKEARESFEAMMKSLAKSISNSFAKHETGVKYLPKLQLLDSEKMADRYIEGSKLDRDEFNVIIHGDLWSNNIMFRHNDEGKLQETILIDFQMSRFASPVVDLYYFLMSSPKLNIKVELFDEFIKFYHDNLLENLKLLNYPKKSPTMKQLRMDLLKHSFWCIGTTTGVLAVVLLDPTENASLNNFFDEHTEAIDFQANLYGNPRYIKHLDVLLPWMDKMGYLDD